MGMGIDGRRWCCWRGRFRVFYTGICLRCWTPYSIPWRKFIHSTYNHCLPRIQFLSNYPDISSPSSGSFKSSCVDLLSTLIPAHKVNFQRLLCYNIFLRIQSGLCSYRMILSRNGLMIRSRLWKSISPVPSPCEVWSSTARWNISGHLLLNYGYSSITLFRGSKCV